MRDDRERQLLAPLLERSETAAIICDIDGTIAPIAARAEEARVPAETRELLAHLSRRYKLVACVSGRRAADARRLVGIESLTYVGNHGLERLEPGAAHADASASLAEHAATVRSFATSAYTPPLRQMGVRLEDKDAIWAFHWRGAPDEKAASRALAEVATAATESGLQPHWGRKVLEIRPPTKIDKGTALARLVGDAGVESALYGGDDTTDLDAFRALRELQGQGMIEDAVCVGVASEEGPSEIRTEADLVVDGPTGFRELLSELAL